jgi:hypothetical protein
MTDQELKDLVASLAIQSAKTDQELKDLFANLAIQSAKTDAQMAKTDQELKDLIAQSAKTDAQMAKTGKELKDLATETHRKLAEVGRQLGDIGHSNGDAAENYFFNSLEDNIKLGKIKFDTISRNVKQRKHRLEDEYDIFLENGNAVGIIEVKYKVRKDHIEGLLEKKAENFRILFPDYHDYKLYIGIAGLSIDAENEQYAIENGLVVLKQKGDIMQINSQNMKAF